MSGERGGRREAKDWRFGTVPDAPVAGVHFPGKLGVAEAFAAFLLIAFFARCLISSFLQGIRDVRSSPLPVPEDTQRRAMNRAYAEEQKKKKDAKVARRTKRTLEREKLDARR